MPTISNNLVGTAGEYYVCAELCRRGYLALLTPKNNPLFDVVATNASGSASVSIQVKARSPPATRRVGSWGAAKTPEQTPGAPFVVLVSLANVLDGRLSDFYIYRHDEFVARVSEVFEHYMNTPKRAGGAHKDPGFRWFNEASFTDEDRRRMNDWDPIVRELGGAP